MPSRTNNPFEYIKTLFEVTKEQVERKMRRRYVNRLLDSIDEFPTINRLQHTYGSIHGDSERTRKKTITVTKGNCYMRYNNLPLPVGTKIETEGGFLKEIILPKKK